MIHLLLRKKTLHRFSRELGPEFSRKPACFNVNVFWHTDRLNMLLNKLHVHCAEQHPFQKRGWYHLTLQNLYKSSTTGSSYSWQKLIPDPWTDRWTESTLFDRRAASIFPLTLSPKAPERFVEKKHIKEIKRGTIQYWESQQAEREGENIWLNPILRKNKPHSSLTLMSNTCSSKKIRDLSDLMWSRQSPRIKVGRACDALSGHIQCF